MSQIAKLPLRQVDSVQKLLMNDQAKGQLAAVAAKHMSPERLMRITANAIRTTPKLQACEPLSFLGALMQCASLGLEPNTVMGHAYLIPFDNRRQIDGKWVKVPEVQLVIGYKGLIDLARRSGHITSISANVHYSDDELWEYEEGTEARLRHIPGPQEGERLHAYAIARFKEGGHAYVVLPWAKVMKIRNGSSGWQAAVKFGTTEKSPWFTHEEAMAQKTAIRALSKYLPLSVEFRDAVAVDHDSGATVDYQKFALQPEEGVTIDGEVVDEPEVEADPKPEEKKPEPEKRPKAKADPKSEPKGDEPSKAEPKASKHDKTYDDFMSGLHDGAPVEDSRRFYEEELEAMKTEAPDLFEELQRDIAEFEKAAGKSEGGDDGVEG